MNVGMNTAVSALNALSQRHAVHANNVANVNTDEFNKGRTLAQEQTPYGVSNTFETVDTQGPLRVENVSGTEAVIEGSNVELAEEMPNDMVTQRSFEANAAMVRTEDEMLGTILDMIA
ncbi:MAG: flagellar basal body rod C-terminal domain-containing protein [Planctomycetota bacterium]|jgi:flagellar basal-body rod protein FlgC